jgi:hypothetical protein
VIDQLIIAVADHSVTSEDGDHLLVHSYYPDLIHSDGRVVTCQQASGYLQVLDWEPVSPTCGVVECVRPDHLDHATVVKDEQDLQLVAAHAVSLADLYRAGRKRGLLTAQSTGYGG